MENANERLKYDFNVSVNDNEVKSQEIIDLKSESDDIKIQIEEALNQVEATVAAKMSRRTGILQMWLSKENKEISSNLKKTRNKWSQKSKILRNIKG